jgi:hypothetical protein
MLHMLLSRLKDPFLSSFPPRLPGGFWPKLRAQARRREAAHVPSQEPSPSHSPNPVKDASRLNLRVASVSLGVARTMALLVAAEPAQGSKDVDDAVTDESDTEADVIQDGNTGKGAAMTGKDATFSSIFNQVMATHQSPEEHLSYWSRGHGPKKTLQHVSHFVLIRSSFFYHVGARVFACGSERVQQAIPAC